MAANLRWTADANLNAHAEIHATFRRETGVDGRYLALAPRLSYETSIVPLRAEFRAGCGVPKIRECLV